MASEAISLIRDVWYLFIPAIPLIPMLLAPIPMYYHPAREVAGAFQTIAIIDDGWNSYTYITLQESFSALHLHSLLSSIFVGVGYTEGGRLVSFLGALSTVLLLVWIGLLLGRRRAGIIAGATLW